MKRLAMFLAIVLLITSVVPAYGGTGIGRDSGVICEENTTPVSPTSDTNAAEEKTWIFSAHQSDLHRQLQLTFM